MVRRQAAFIVLALCLPCAQAPGRGPASWPVSDAPQALQPAITRADLIILELRNAMLAELTSALRTRGEAGAVHSCHVDAIGVAQRVARQTGIPAGRTSDRLRNPTNAPRPWAAPIVAAHAGRRAAEIDGFAVDLGDHIGVLRPIAQTRMCAGCHGPAERLSPRVLAELKDRYPADRGVGFAEGEIRGWFWVEIPKASAP